MFCLLGYSTLHIHRPTIFTYYISSNFTSCVFFRGGGRREEEERKRSTLRTKTLQYTPTQKNTTLLCLQISQGGNSRPFWFYPEEEHFEGVQARDKELDKEAWYPCLGVDLQAQLMGLVVVQIVSGLEILWRFPICEKRNPYDICAHRRGSRRRDRVVGLVKVSRS